MSKTPTALQATTVKQAQRLLAQFVKQIEMLNRPIKRLSMAIASSGIPCTPDVDSNSNLLANSVTSNTAETKTSKRLFNLATDELMTVSSVQGSKVWAPIKPAVRSSSKKQGLEEAAAGRVPLSQAEEYDDDDELLPNEQETDEPLPDSDETDEPLPNEDGEDDEEIPVDEEEEEEQVTLPSGVRVMMPDDEYEEDDEYIEPEKDPDNQLLRVAVDQDEDDEDEVIDLAEIDKAVTDLKQAIQLPDETDDGDELPPAPAPAPVARPARPNQKDGTPITSPPVALPTGSQLRPRASTPISVERPQRQRLEDLEIEEAPGPKTELPLQAPTKKQAPAPRPSVDRPSLDDAEFVDKKDASTLRLSDKAQQLPPAAPKISVDLNHPLFKPEKEKQLLQNWTLLRQLYAQLNTLQLTKNQWEVQFKTDPLFKTLMSELDTSIAGLKGKITAAQKVLTDIDRNQVPKELREVVSKVALELNKAWSADNVHITYFYQVLDVPIAPGKEPTTRGGGRSQKGLSEEMRQFLIKKVYKPAAEKRAAFERQQGPKDTTQPSAPSQAVRKEIFFVGIVTFKSVFSRTAELIDEYNVIVTVHIPSVSDKEGASYSTKNDIWSVNTSFELNNIVDLFKQGREFSGRPEDAWDQVVMMIEQDIMPPPTRLNIYDHQVPDKDGNEMPLSQALVKSPDFEPFLSTEPDPDNPGKWRKIKLKYARFEDNSLLVVPEVPLDRNDKQRIHTLISSMAYVLNRARFSPRTGQRHTHIGKERVVGTWVDIESYDKETKKETVEVGVRVWLAPFKHSGIWTADQVAMVSDMLKLTPDQEYDLRAYLL